MRRQIRSYGQSGAFSMVPPHGLNRDEWLVWVRLLHAGATVVALETLAKALERRARDPDLANSWARNALRRLVRAGYAEVIGRGTYRAGMPHCFEQREIPVVRPVHFIPGQPAKPQQRRRVA